jgi:hypothetical protein
VTSIRIDELVFVLLKNGSNADSDRLKSALEVAKTADLLPGLGVFLVGSLFEPPDEHHHPEPFALGLSFGLIARIRGTGDCRRTLRIDGVGNCHV